MNLNEFAAWLGSTLTVTNFDGRPDAADGNYAYWQIADPLSSRTDLAAARRDLLTAHIVCVGVDPTGSRWIADRVRGVLVGARPDQRHMLVEQPAGPQLTEGTPTSGGERYSITLTFQLITRRTP